MDEYTSVVKPMARGQITLPIQMRKVLGITPETWLWVKLEKRKILIEPLEKQPADFRKFTQALRKIAKSRKAYWAKSDSSLLKRMRTKSRKRLKKLLK